MPILVAKETEEFSYTLTTSEDNLKIFASAKPKSSKLIETNKVKDTFYAELPNAVLHEDVIIEIAELLKKGQDVSERRIAKGFPAEDGADGKFLLLVKPYTGKISSSTEDKGIHQLLQRHLFDNILVNTVIGRIYPPKDGKEGKDAFGKVLIPKQGKPVKISLDKSLTTRKGPDGTFEEVISTIDGLLVDESGKLTVKPELVISGNLDFHLGNLDFVGTIRISGDIAPGFTVQAKKGIEVSGTIRQVTLLVADGDIKINGFAFGGENSKIVCSGQFQGTVAQELSIESHGDIIISKEAIDCRLQSERCVFAEQGSIIGGDAYVAAGVQAKKIGNEAGKKTTIFLCSGVETRTEYRKLVAQIEEHKKALSLMELHLGPLVKNPDRIQLLKEPHRTKMKELHFKHGQVHSSKAMLLKKQREMLENSKPVDGLRVNVMSIMYPGTVIKSSDAEWICTEEIKGPKSIVYSAETKEFLIKDIEPLVMQSALEKKDGKQKK